MKKSYLFGFITVTILLISCSSIHLKHLKKITLTQELKNELTNLTLTEQIKKGDELWLKKGANFAIPAYKYALKNIKKTDNVYIPTISMRIAQASLVAKDKQSAMNAINSLKKLEYIPEHQKLRSEEIKTIMQGKNDPGLAKTEIPPEKSIKVTIYVDYNQKKEGDGSKNTPYKTLQKAIKTATKELKKNQKGVVKIALLPGNHIVKKTITLDENISGNKNSHLLITSADPENPATITGGIVLSKWEKVNNKKILNTIPEKSRDKVLFCKLKKHGIKNIGKLSFGGFSSKRAAGDHARFETMPVVELFYKNNPQTMARWPNKKLTRIHINEVPKKYDARFAKWAKEKELWLYGYWKHDWADAYEKVANIAKNGKISLVPPVNRYNFSRRIGCVINALCELDTPGEWYLDTEKNLIYYYPPENFNPNQCILSSFKTPITARKCNYLKITNINLNFICGDALIFNNCSNLILAKLNITKTSGYAIKIYGGKHHLIHSCSINSMGRGGIDLKVGDWQKLDNSYTIVENCRISNLSRIDRTYTPAVLAEGMGIKIRYNEFIHIPSSAIRIEACDTLVELNLFKECVYESGDQGALDMWANPLYRGNIIRWNFFDSIINNNAHFGAAGVRCDDFISGFMISENIFNKGSNHGFGAVQNNQGADNYIEGNIIIDWTKAFSGISKQGKEWVKRIKKHKRSKILLKSTPWQSEKWLKKYPMLKTLMPHNNNCDYIIDNTQLGKGSWGGIFNAKTFLSTRGSKDFHLKSLDNIESQIQPWHPIPYTKIGNYK